MIKSIRISTIVLTAILMAIVLFGATSCNKETKTVINNKVFKIAVFVPGMVQGSPTYEMMVTGVNDAVIKAAGTRTIEVKVVEGGYNQGEWQNGLTALATTGEYDLIVSSNPSMPEIAQAVATAVPVQKFLILDGYLKDNKSIKTIAFNQYEQGFLNGYFAALLSSSNLPKANKDLIIGLVAGQEYPIMNEQIKVGFLDGAHAVNPSFSLDFRVLGNWYDAAKAAELAKSMIDSKVDVILAIAGGGNQGVIAAARDAGAYVTWFDSPGSAAAPGIVLGGTIVKQAGFCTEAILKAVEGTLDFGVPGLVGIKESAVGFDFDSPDSIKFVPPPILEAEKKLLSDIMSGTIVLKGK